MAELIQRIILRDADAAEWLIFSEPDDVLFATQTSDVFAVLAEIEGRVNNEGLFAAGFVCYEAAPGFDQAFVTHTESQLPLLCFGLFKNPERVKSLDGVIDEGRLAIDWEMNESQDDYRKKLATIKQQIELGNTYQINYTVRQKASGITDPWYLFTTIAGDDPFAAFVECDNHVIVSASPELFFQLNNDQLTSKPMKGTSARGMTLVDDLELRDALSASVKNRAENVMITDMLRNDMGRVARAGSVNVPTMLELEKYPTVWQMTSTVSAQTDASVAEIFQALFPCASVTGAPKVSSMKIIAELESSPRGIYTGAIGYVGPERKAQFNVAIRTAVIDKETGDGVYGVGGGIVWDSDSDDEYSECLTKARVLNLDNYHRDFELLETILWTELEGFHLLEQHMKRMSASAAYFDFQFDQESIERVLLELTRKLLGQRHRIRLLLRPDGQFRLTQGELKSAEERVSVRIRLAAKPIDRNNPFLYHKTTHREIYDRALRSVGDGDDVLLWNTDGFITETSIANLLMRTDDRWITPPVDCGLLPGTYREWLLENGEVEERKIHIDELSAGQDFVLVNSVRGRYRARLA